MSPFEGVFGDAATQLANQRVAGLEEILTAHRSSLAELKVAHETFRTELEGLSRDLRADRETGLKRLRQLYALAVGFPVVTEAVVRVGAHLIH